MTSKKSTQASTKKLAGKRAMGSRGAKATSPVSAARGRATAPAKPSQTAGSKSAGSKPAARGSAGRKTPARTARRQDAPEAPKSSGHPAIFYRLHTLLHLVRNIAHYEDHLCTILHEIKTSGAADGELSHELAAVLEEMPSTDYTQELARLRSVL